MDILQSFKDYVRSRCSSECTPQTYTDRIHRLLTDELLTNPGNNADYYVLSEQIQRCISQTDNSDHGTIGDSKNMIAYANTNAECYAVVFHTTVMSGYFVIDLKEQRCAAPKEYRDDIVFLNSILNAAACDPKETVINYMKKYDAGIVYEYLRIAKLTGRNTTELEAKLLAFAMNEEKDTLAQVAEYIRCDLI